MYFLIGVVLMLASFWSIHCKTKYFTCDWKDIDVEEKRSLYIFLLGFFISVVSLSDAATRFLM